MDGIVKQNDVEKYVDNVDKYFVISVENGF